MLKFGSRGGKLSCPRRTDFTNVIPTVASSKSSFFEGSFGAYVLPGIILQSVLIGGGYATGREIVEYGAKYGALGWVAGLGIFLGFVLIGFLTFEFARLHQTYDYRSFFRALIGRAWFLFDVAYLAMAILAIAVVSSAAGEILLDTLRVPYLAGVTVIILLVGLLNFYGAWLIERFKSVVTGILVAAYLAFGGAVIGDQWANVEAVFATGATGFVEGEIGLGAVLWTGLLYVGYNLATFPAAFFAMRRQTTRTETLGASLVAGALMCTPWFFTYVALMGFYPSEAVMGAPVPWLVMLREVSPVFLVLFGGVVGVTLIETATGMIHAFIHRLDAHLREVADRSLSEQWRGGIAVTALVLALLLAQVGIIDLIARGYLAMAYALIAVYAVPLLTVGVYRIVFQRNGN